VSTISRNVIFTLYCCHWIGIFYFIWITIITIIGFYKHFNDMSFHQNFIFISFTLVKLYFLYACISFSDRELQKN
jgi:hypothetical protein